MFDFIKNIGDIKSMTPSKLNYLRITTLLAACVAFIGLINELIPDFGLTNLSYLSLTNSLLFISALTICVITEIKLNGKLKLPTKKDIRLGREFVSYHQEAFRILLKENDYTATVGANQIHEMNSLISDHNLGKIKFNNQRVQKKYDNFIYSLIKFDNHLCKVISARAGSYRIIPEGHRMGFDIKKEHQDEIDITHNNAVLAWNALSGLVKVIELHIPECHEDEINVYYPRNKIN